MQSTHYSYKILIKLHFYWQLFKKFRNIKFNKNSSCGNQAVPCWCTGTQTDRHDKGNSHLSQFCKCT